MKISLSTVIKVLASKYQGCKIEIVPVDHHMAYVYIADGPGVGSLNYNLEKNIAYRMTHEWGMHFAAINRQLTKTTGTTTLHQGDLYEVVEPAKPVL